MSLDEEQRRPANVKKLNWKLKCKNLCLFLICSKGWENPAKKWEWPDMKDEQLPENSPAAQIRKGIWSVYGQKWHLEMRVRNMLPTVWFLLHLGNRTARTFCKWTGFYQSSKQLHQHFPLITQPTLEPWISNHWGDKEAAGLQFLFCAAPLILFLFKLLSHSCKLTWTDTSLCFKKYASLRNRFQDQKYQWQIYQEDITTFLILFF